LAKGNLRLCSGWVVGGRAFTDLGAIRCQTWWFKVHDYVGSAHNRIGWQARGRESQRSPGRLKESDSLLPLLSSQLQRRQPQEHCSFAGWWILSRVVVLRGGLTGDPVERHDAIAHQVKRISVMAFSNQSGFSTRLRFRSTFETAAHCRLLRSRT